MMARWDDRRSRWANLIARYRRKSEIVAVAIKFVSAMKVPQVYLAGIPFLYAWQWQPCAMLVVETMISETGRAIA